MTGIISKPIFVKDGQYLSMVTAAAVTLGKILQLTETGVIHGAANKTCIGVASNANRTSRTQADGVVASGDKVTVVTRGIVNVTTGTSTILKGSFLEMGADGIVELSGTAGTNVPSDVIGVALEANGGVAATIQMQLRLN